MEILFWNPFLSDAEIQEMGWYKTLSTYGLNRDTGTWNTDPFNSVHKHVHCM